MTLGVLNTNLIKLVLHKMHYLQSSALEVSQNVAKADIAGARRRELKPFEKVISKTSHGGIAMNLQSKDVINTQEFINRENEVMNMQNISMDYQAMVQIYKRYHDMIRLVIGKA